MEMEVGGVIYPIPMKHLELLRTRNDPAYIKYLTQKTNLFLKEGHYVLFYVTKKEKSILSYSKVKKICFLSPEQIIENKLGNIQMNKEDFEEYTSNRKTKPLFFLELEKIYNFEAPVFLNYPITMTGKRIFKGELDKIIKK